MSPKKYVHFRNRIGFVEPPPRLGMRIADFAYASSTSPTSLEPLALEWMMTTIAFSSSLSYFWSEYSLSSLSRVFGPERINERK